uniref:Uncharacterized protein n=1 Tax=Globisporangium ultimum (strain ATCC 200006 / CBS 805.95 / DAOM BR144) TaxID=431595 RepID=K3X0Q0_GLOUD
MASANSTTSGSSDGSSSADAADAAVTTASSPPARTYTVAPKLEPYNSYDTCAWYEQSQCYMPRSCYDCINVALRRDECVVDPMGLCVSITNYKHTLAAAGNVSNPDVDGYYPSANYTYCSINDNTCNACRARWRQVFDSTGAAPELEMCRGADGCICLSICEMPNRKQQIISSRCSSFGMMAAPSKLIMTMYLGAAVIGLLLLTLLMFKAWERKKREDARTEARRERRERRRNRLPPSGPQLSLTGWNSLRDKLLETELVGDDTLPRDGVRNQINKQRGNARLTMVISHASDSSSSRTTSASSGADMIVVPTIVPTVQPKRSAYYDLKTCDQSRCSAPRCCESCINVIVPGKQCSVDGWGTCATLDESIQGEFNTVSDPIDPRFGGYFPAANFTYCSNSDTTCAQCKGQWLRENQWRDMSSLLVCRGESGCICIARTPRAAKWRRGGCSVESNGVGYASGRHTARS